MKLLFIHTYRSNIRMLDMFHDTIVYRLENRDPDARCTSIYDYIYEFYDNILYNMVMGWNI